jgi:hypothetical protein
MERMILKWVAPRPLPIANYIDLPIPRSDTTTWEVKAPALDQILPVDFTGATKPWPMIQSIANAATSASRQHFGSTLTWATERDCDKPKLGTAFCILLPFHKFYSRVLLSNARPRLQNSVKSSI